MSRRLAPTLAIATIVVAIATAEGGAQQQPASHWDSLTSHRGARNAVTVFQGLYTFYMSYSPPVRLPFLHGKCVDLFCFGPENGNIRYGAQGVVMPVMFPTADPVLPRDRRGRAKELLDDLLKRLDDAQARIPGDQWILGQRVLHRVRDMRLAEADSVALSCRAARWWCSALVGYTSDLLLNFKRADSAFTAALTEMPAAERCTWEDISDLTYGDRDRGWYTKLKCPARPAANETLWWLSDPLYVTPGNERRTAHYFRVVHARLTSDAHEELPQIERRCPPNDFDCRLRGTPASPRIPPAGLLGGISLFDRDIWQTNTLTSLIRSLGAPVYLIIERPLDPAAAQRPMFLLQFPQPTYHFVAAMSAVQAPMRATASSWRLDDAFAEERYHPTFGFMSSLSHQIAFFRRGDSARVVAAVDIASNELLARAGTRPIATALVLTRSARDGYRIVRDSVALSNVVYDVRAARESTLVSIEAVATGLGAARARLAAGPPPMPEQRVTMSDLLVLGRAEPLPADLESAIGGVARNVTQTQGSALGVFWEMYGLVAGDTVTFALSATETGTTTATRIGRILGVARDALSPRVVWREFIPTSSPIAPRAVAIDLSALSRGSYTLRLEVSVPGQRVVNFRRDFEVVQR